MIRHGRYHDERMAEDHDESERESGSWLGVLAVAVALFAIVMVATLLSPNARW